LKQKDDSKLDLYFVAQQIEGGLRGLASNKKASGTLTRPALESFKFQLTDKSEEMDEVGSLRKEIAILIDRFQ
jgi:hypothetical protein